MGKVAVIGSFNVDLTAKTPYMPAPGETLIGSNFKMGPGGKGSNQGVAAHRAGADVTMVAKVGDDLFGKLALDIYKNEGMRTDYILVDPEAETGTALIMINEQSAQNSIIVVSGANARFTDEDIEKIKPVIKESDYVLLQFEINLDAVLKIIDYAYSVGVKVMLNTAPAHPIPDEYLAKVDTITPNEIEAEIMSGVKITDEASAEKACKVLLAKGVKNAVVTMGKAGVYVMNEKGGKMIKSHLVKAVDTTGAGDAFNGGFITAAMEGMDLFEAARFGNCTGALAVTKRGAAGAMPYRKEIDELFNATK